MAKEQSDDRTDSKGIWISGKVTHKERGSGWKYKTRRFTGKGMEVLEVPLM